MTTGNDKRRRQEARILREITRQISGTLDLQEILTVILKLTSEHLSGAFKGSIYLFNPRSLLLETRAYFSQDKQFQQELRFSLAMEKGITLWAFRNKRSVRVANVETDPQWHDLYIAADPLHPMFSELDVPLLDGQEAIGLINFTSTQPDAFTEADQSFLEALARQTVVPIKNAQRHQDVVEQRVTELAVLREIERQISSTLDLDKILHTILVAASGHIKGAFKGSIYLFNQRTQKLETRAFYSEDPTFYQSSSFSLTEAKGITPRVFLSKRPVRIDNIKTDPEWHDYYVGADPHHPMLSELYVPLLSGEEAIGVINFASTRPQAFTASDEEFLNILVEHVVLAINYGFQHEAVVKRRLAELNRLQKIEHQINSTLDLDKILHAILEAASEQIPEVYVGAILLYNERTHMLETKAHIPEDPHFEPNRQVDVSENGKRGITRDVYLSKKSLRIGNIPEDPLYRTLYIPPTKADPLHPTLSELDVPLLDGNEAIGVISFESALANAFSQEAQDYLETLAGQAVLAINNSRKFQSVIDRRFTELTQLREIDRQITSTLELKIILQTILTSASEHLVRAYKGAILLFNPQTQALETEAFYSDDEAYRERLHFPLSGLKGITLKAFLNKQTIRVANVTKDPEWRDLYVSEKPYSFLSELDVPLLDGDQAIGVINFESQQEGVFSPADEVYLETLAGQVVLAIKNGRLYKEMEHIAENQQTVLEIIGRITNQDDIERIYEPILAKALKHTNSSAGTLMLYNAQQGDLYIAAQLEIPLPKERRQQIGEGIIGQAALKKLPLIVGDVTQSPWQCNYSDYVQGIHSELAVPILEGEALRGVINIKHPQENQYSPKDLEFLKTLAELTLVVIQKVKAIDRLKEAEAVATIGKVRFQLAHQLTNDLGRIRSYINLIQQELAFRQIQSSAISTNLDRIAHAVTQVLNLADAFRERFAKSVDPTVTEAKGLINMANVIREWASKKKLELPQNIKLQYEVQEDLASVYGVYEQIQEILSHLIQNAEQAMTSGGVLTLRARNVDNFVEIQVQDTGRGIPKDMLDHIFKPGFTTKKDGSGFGLYHALDNAHNNGGELQVASSSGEGTTFTLLLPIARNAKGGIV